MLKTKILVVDDTIVFTGILQGLLEKEYDVKIANSGEEALEIVEDFNPNIILLDVMMPGLDGYEVCEKIKSQKKFEHIKILFLSGMTEPEERIKGYDVGGDDYITKPFIQKELMAKIKVYSQFVTQNELNTTKSNMIEMMSYLNEDDDDE